MAALMTTFNYLTILRRPNIMVAIYAFAVFALLFLTVASVIDIVIEYTERNSSVAMLESFRARSRALLKGHGATQSDLPFLSGRSPTIASAVLLQRVTGAIVSSHGRVLSSEVDDQSARVKNGELKTTIHFQIDQVDLQKLVYDLESGEPYLFVKQIDIQTKDSENLAAPVLNVVMEVSGIWRGPK
jgi:general secretion pathway protein M